MDLDRSLFLALSAALAASACATEPPPHPKTVLNAPSDDSHAGPSSNLHAGNNADAAAGARGPSNEPSGQDANRGTPPATSETAPPVSPAPSPPKKAPLGADELCAKSAKKYDPAKTGCKDDAPTPVDCKTIVAYPATELCEGPKQARAHCAVHKKFLKPKIAKAALACQQRIKPANYCDSCPAETCAYEALLGACPDVAVEPICKTIGTKCEGVDSDHCQSLLAGLVDSARKEVVDCLAKDCAMGIWGCVQGLLQDEMTRQ